MKHIMLNDKIIDAKLIKLNIDVESDEEVITELSKLLIWAGYVKIGFPSAVIERERVFPTGLPTIGGINIAIPHTDDKYVDQAAVAIGVIKNPVNFKMMENPDKSISVKIVFLLALIDHNDQISILQNIAKIIQNKDLLNALVTEDTEEGIARLIEKNLAM